MTRIANKGRRVTSPPFSITFHESSTTLAERLRVHYCRHYSVYRESRGGSRRGDTATKPMLAGEDTPPRLHGTQRRVRLHTQLRRTQTRDTTKRMTHTVANRPHPEQQYSQRSPHRDSSLRADKTKFTGADSNRRPSPLRFETLLRVIRLPPPTQSAAVTKRYKVGHADRDIYIGYDMGIRSIV